MLIGHPWMRSRAPKPLEMCLSGSRHLVRVLFDWDIFCVELGFGDNCYMIAVCHIVCQPAILAVCLSVWAIPVCWERRTANDGRPVEMAPPGYWVHRLSRSTAALLCTVYRHRGALDVSPVLVWSRRDAAGLELTPTLARTQSPDSPQLRTSSDTLHSEKTVVPNWLCIVSLEAGG